jgi:hypothetical protein
MSRFGREFGTKRYQIEKEGDGRGWRGKEGEGLVPYSIPIIEMGHDFSSNHVLVTIHDVTSASRERCERCCET